MSAASTDGSLPGGLVAARGERPHVLVWVGNHAQADALVRHAAGLARSNDASWTAICVASPDEKHDADRPTLALRALALAESLGARTVTIDGGDVVADVVSCARREGASIVLVGGHAPAGWLEGLPRHWLSGLAETLSTRLPEAVVDVVYLPEAEPAPRPAATTQAPRWRVQPGWLHAVAVVLVCLLVSEALLPYLEHASIAVVYLTGVVYIALRHGESASMLAVILSILLFDLLVVEPRWSLKPTDPQYYFTFLVMALVGMLVSRLADRARRQALVADARARRAQALNELAGRLLSAPALADVAEAVTSAVRDTFGADSALLPSQPGDALVDDANFCAPEELAVARRALAEGRPVEAEADAAALLCLPLSAMAGPRAVLALRWPAGHAATPEDRRLLDAFANQAALALQRIWFEQRSAAAAVEAEAERLRNTLLSGISHDFRTPLTSIVGSAASLLEQHDALGASERAGLLRNIVDEAGRMHAAMSDLLDLTRMEQGAVKARCEWCPADELVQEARAALGERLRQRTLRIAVPPEAIVWCDPRLVQQALVNLLDNALRHTPAGSAIDVRIETGAASWTLVVADDGPGLPPELRREPFRKFAHGRSEGGSAGTGLGLALCAAVARLHDGRIEAADQAGHGTRFTLTLPQPSAPPAALEEAA